MTPPQQPPGQAVPPGQTRPVGQTVPAGQTGQADGILAGIRLDKAVHTVLVLLVLASVVRYVSGHGLGDRAGWVIGGAALMLLSYAAYPFALKASAPSPVSPGAPDGQAPPRWHSRARGAQALDRWQSRARGAQALQRAWLALLAGTWLVLALLAPSFAWCAVPLCFLALRMLPFTPACLVIAAMVLTVIVAWTRMTGRFDATIVAGPICIAVLAVGAYRQLEQEAEARQVLLDGLREAQDELAEAQHQAGVLAERGRISREIHDSVAQGLSSINLLLQAAQQEWSTDPAAAQTHIGQAALAARSGLDDVRAVVRDLASWELSTGDLPTALARAAEAASGQTGLEVQVRVEGDPVSVAPDLATALVRTVRGALANVVEHGAASTAVVTLTYQPDVLTLDVRDDGVGFEPAGLVPPSGSAKRGRGLAGMRQRAEALGGSLVIESAPGDGTALAMTLPLEADR